MSKINLSMDRIGRSLHSDGSEPMSNRGALGSSHTAISGRSQVSMQRSRPCLSDHRSVSITKHYQLSEHILEAFDTSVEQGMHPTSLALGMQFLTTALLEIPQHGYYFSPNHVKERIMNATNAVRVCEILQAILDELGAPETERDQISGFLMLALELSTVSASEGNVHERRASLEESYRSSDHLYDSVVVDVPEHIIGRDNFRWPHTDHVGATLDHISASSNEVERLRPLSPSEAESFATQQQQRGVEAEVVEESFHGSQTSQVPVPLISGTDARIAVPVYDETTERATTSPIIEATVTPAPTLVIEATVVQPSSSRRATDPIFQPDESASSVNYDSLLELANQGPFGNESLGDLSDVRPSARRPPPASQIADPFRISDITNPSFAGSLRFSSSGVNPLRSSTTSAGSLALDEIRRLSISEPDTWGTSKHSLLFQNVRPGSGQPTLPRERSRRHTRGLSLFDGHSSLNRITEGDDLQRALFLSGLQVQTNGSEVAPLDSLPPGNEATAADEVLDQSVRLGFATLSTVYHGDFDELRENNQVRVSLIETYQGRVKESTNGCAIISPLLCYHHILEDRILDPGLLDETISEVIDNEAPFLLQELRGKLGLSNQAFLIPSDANDFMIENGPLAQELFIDVFGGNVLDDSHMRNFVDSLGRSRVRRAGASFFFHEHVVNILKLPQDENGQMCWYDCIDSHPYVKTYTKELESVADYCERFDFLYDGEETSLPRTTRVRCLSLRALQIFLRWFACSKFSAENISYIDAYSWKDHKSDFDPRVFQAFLRGSAAD